MTTPWLARRSERSTLRQDDQRTPWQRDRARILHSAAFRRLQAKTQIMGVGQNDFYRTRLTHSLEAAQIGTGLVTQLRRRYVSVANRAIHLPDDSLIDALCLAHDIGHPPFGHGGETALNYKMLHAGGFEGNGQTFRIVARLEPYTEHHGMDLTRRTLLGLLKYPVLPPTELGDNSEAAPLCLTPWKAVKSVFHEDADVLDWVLAPLSDSDRQQFQQVDTLPHSPWLKSRYKSLDASIMELADDIAYGVHDLEDAIVTGHATAEQWQQQMQTSLGSLPEELQHLMQQVGTSLFRAEHHLRKDAIGALVNLFITSAELHDVLPDCEEPLIRLNACLPEPQKQLLDVLKRFVFTNVISQPDIQQTRFRCQNMLLRMFDAFASDPKRLLPLNTQQRWHDAEHHGQGLRVICDYLSGMTDEYAETMYKKLFGAL